MIEKFLWKTRLMETKIIIWNACLVAFVAIYCGWTGLVWWSCFMPENYRELCVTVAISKPHMFVIDGNDACQINWFYLIKEPFLFSILLLLPFLALGKVIKFLLKFSSDKETIGQ